MKKLEVKNICRSFDDKPVLRNVSIELNCGETVCLLGISGGGKTTLFNIIAGLLMPDSGSVLLDGEDVTGKSGRISYMMQKDLLLPYMTVEDNVALPLVLRGVKKRAARLQAADLLKQFGLDGTEKKYPAQLSGGMRQRVALMRTYAFSHQVALLDEPFSALDALTKAAIHRWYMDMMAKTGLSTLFITHDVDEAVLLADRVYVLSGEQGSIAGEVVIKEPRHCRTDFNLTPEFLAYKRKILELLKQ